MPCALPNARSEHHERGARQHGARPVAKDLLPLAPDTPLADRRNMLYAGTHVTAGRARAVVIATGLSTETGHIAALAGAAEQPKTPLERRVAQFGRYIMVAAALMFVAVNAIGFLRGMPFAEIVMVAISQVVGMIGGLVLGNLLQAAVVFPPPLASVFHTVPFSLREVVAIGAVASLVLWVEELRKLVVRRRDRRLARAVP